MTGSANLPPSAYDLRKHLFVVLGTKANWRSSVFFDHDEIKREVIQRAGFDPDNLEQYGNPKDGWRMDGGHSNCKSFGRRIWSAFRRGYWLKKKPLTQRGPKRGQWGLTPDGIEMAQSFISVPAKTKGNSTSLFLDRRLKETGGINGPFWRLLRAAVASKFPVSKDSGLVDDHIQTCMMRLIHRDALRTRIEEGRNITDTHIATYVVRSSINDCRDAATEPITRELYGARTAKERKHGSLAALTSENRYSVTWDAENGCWDDIIDPGFTNHIDHRLEFQSAWEKIKQVVRYHHPARWREYMRFLELKSEGHTLNNIAEKMDIAPGRSHAMMSGFRDCMDDIWESGALEGVMVRNQNDSNTSSALSM